MKKLPLPYKIIVWLIGLILLGLIVALYVAQYSNKKFRIGTGDPGGTYYSYVENLSEISEDDLIIEKIETSGTVASIRLLQKGFIDGAIVQNDLLYEAANGTEYFVDENTKDNLNFSAVSGLYTEAFQLVTHSDSGINTIEDLKGKRVSVGEDQSGIILNASQILAFYGLTFDDMNCKYLSISESAKALSNGEIDAFFCMAGAPTKAISESMDNSSLKLISLADKDMDKIINLYPFYEKCVIPAGTYPGINEDVNTLGVKAVLVVVNGRSEKEVKRLTDDVISHSESLNEGIATNGILTPEDATEGVSIPFHPGAANYYSEYGITVPASEVKPNNMTFGSQDK